MDASVLRLVPRSDILSSQERGKMAVIQYEKACTNSYLNLISIRLQGHNVITKGPRLQSQIEETTPIRSPNKYRLLLHLFEKAFDQLKRKGWTRPSAFKRCSIVPSRGATKNKGDGWDIDPKVEYGAKKPISLKGSLTQ
ncbi:hypothetical protein ACOSP7_023667 [Xanthoceras sorbifolium]